MSIDTANIPAMGPGVPGGNTTNASAFDLNVLNNEVRFDVRAYSVCSVTAVPATTWATATLTVYQSPDGVNVFPLGSLTPSLAFSGALSVSGINFIIVRVALVEGSQKFVNIRVDGKAATLTP